MAVREKIVQTTDLGYFEGAIPIQYRYTYGLAGEEFFRKLMKGKLTASVSKKNRTVYCPPRIFCEDCFEELSDIIELSGKGTVVSYTVCYEDLHGNRQEPVTIAMVQFDGADTAFAALLVCDDPFIGMRVELKLVPEKKRKGSITDIFFVPLV
ncbi:MAG: Zn-ribbon domain-containing OB-fold protein [Desulfomonilia bacterium]|nr:Zn-ribbon domain-containing OB-fold protein [Desulfomonilia bacterium]